MARCSCSPALVALRHEINALAPQRSKASDGCCGDAAHAARESDHNPDGSGYAHAQDITHDPDDGVDCTALINQLVARRDARIKYLIWRRRIWRSYDRPQGSRPFLKAWTPETYTGPNPHDKHMHVSIVATATHDRSRWLPTTPLEPLMAAFKNDDEERHAWVVAAYGIFLGPDRTPTLEDLDFWGKRMKVLGILPVLVEIAKGDEAALHIKRRKKVGL